MPAHRTPRPMGFAGLLGQREFGLLWCADAQSLLGDQLARVALSVFVYADTGSALATAGVYALTFLPALIGSVLLGTLADRMPRRGLLVLGDLVQAVLIGLMALPRMPVVAMAALLVVAVLVSAPWKAAEQALLVDILAEEDFVVGSGLRTATVQASQLLGFAVGGVAVAAVGARHALAVDAATFLISALVIQLGIRSRPAAQQHVDEAVAKPRWLDGVTDTWRNRRLRRLMQLSWLIGLLVVPEGLAAPYAKQLGGGPGYVGLLLAAGPAGVLVGTLVYSRRFSAERRAGWLGPLATLAGVPLIACAWTDRIGPTMVLWMLSGVCTAYQVQVVAEFVRIIAPRYRGQGIGLASGGLLAAQGVGLLAGGALTEVVAPTTTVGVAGAAAVVLAGGLALTRRADARAAPNHTVSVESPAAR